jgi:hypothetical protein
MLVAANRLSTVAKWAQAFPIVARERSSPSPSSITVTEKSPPDATHCIERINNINYSVWHGKRSLRRPVLTVLTKS